MSKPTHDILLAENYETGDGEQKAFLTNIGSAWQKDSGAISCKMRDGLAVPGRLGHDQAERGRGAGNTRPIQPRSNRRGGCAD